MEADDDGDVREGIDIGEISRLPFRSKRRKGFCVSQKYFLDTT